jgi:hypothetical protein
MSAGLVPSDVNILALIPNVANTYITRLEIITMLQQERYFFEATNGVSYGCNDTITFESSNLLTLNENNLSDYDNFKLKCLQTLIANANLLTASGTANSISLSLRTIDNSLESGSYAKQAAFPIRFRDGLQFDFVAINDNTGSVTISIPNFEGVNGSLNLVKQDLTPLIEGDIKSGYRYTIICDKTNNRFILKNSFISNATTTRQGLSFRKKQITIANNTTDANNYIDFSDGVFEFSDGSGDAKATALTKKLNSTWVVGGNQGGLFTGSKANSTWYHCFAIYNPTTNVSDFGFDTNVDATNKPSGYTKYKRVGSIRTDASGNIIGFTQDGNEFRWKNPILDLNSVNQLSGNETLRTITAPLGIKTKVQGNLFVNIIAGNNSSVMAQAYDANTTQPTIQMVNGGAYAVINLVYGTCTVLCVTNTSSQIKTNQITVTGSPTVTISFTNAGYIDITL